MQLRGIAQVALSASPWTGLLFAVGLFAGNWRIGVSAAPVIEETVAAALDRELADLGGCVPMADVMAGRHERAEARLFAS
ncbi:urea transporter [Streptomyces sp. 205]|uniref:Urea transporter n=1 Tax=Streptomyces coffeae TaxID=621382 RepID=A0ABS1ND72_9ACTN|nr:urea transporter [Streptomyces coffeae]